MGVNYDIRYHERAVKEDIPALPSRWKKKIKHAIEERLSTSPEVYGKPLRQSLKGYRKLRVGDYRVIFRIERTAVKIFMIKHRSVIYKMIKKRI